MDYLTRVGQATYANKVRIWDSSSGKLTDFTTHFSFFIDTKGSRSYSDGLVFFIAPVGFQIPLNSAGEFLGLFNSTTSGANSINHIICVEFDTYWNPKWDPQGVDNHVGINGDAILTHTIDLKEVLPESATVGFSASTGIVMERHVLQSWEFNSSLDEKETQGVTVNRTKVVILGLGVPSVVLIVGVFGAALMIQRRRRRCRKELGEEMTNHTSITNDLERGAGPKKFSYRQLVSATNNFSDERKLGEGGFGCVYKGFLRELNLTVAVKRISRGSKQGKKEYITEVKAISQLRHRNLVRLIGWCHEKGEFILVYEFMPNGSLDSHLFGKKPPLNWEARYKISLGLASALLYLHEEWEQCVVHRDIKSSNVMLDSNFNAKLGDFGLARLVDHELGPKTTSVAGTIGYLAPEYIHTGKASKEADVYSFGVVALEMACGRKSLDLMEEESLEVGLVEWIWKLYGIGKLSIAVDESLILEEFDVKLVERLMIVGLWCAHPDSTLRPSVRQAIQVLKLEAELPKLPPVMPVPLFHLPLPPAASSLPPLSTSLHDGR
ncbi:hypothetical protein Scep_001399 [Stephania cephalantha]|uniref:Protein kinase domain-containing protein n=1 Tax=Stephania cephalantha TaxID=152367 RepID=A0AAP0Q3X3_9MAGN